MSDRRNGELIGDILEAARRIKGYVGNMTFEDFKRDERTQDAVIRNLELVGEAAKRVSQEFKRRYPNLPWKQMAGMRDVIAHRYFSISINDVWKVAKEDLPKVADVLEGLDRSRS